MQILVIVLVALIVIALLIYLAWRNIGDADIKFYLEKHSPFIVDIEEKDRVVFSTTFDIANEGKQCATIMDCFVRSQLPYEQFDKIVVRGKAQLAGVPREDDYFEAVLIQKHEKIQIVLKIELIDRTGNNIKEALQHVVDIPLDVIYQHTARHETSLSKKRLVIPEKDIKSLLHIELTD